MSSSKSRLKERGREGMKVRAGVFKHEQKPVWFYLNMNRSWSLHVVISKIVMRRCYAYCESLSKTLWLQDFVVHSAMYIEYIKQEAEG